MLACTEIGLLVGPGDSPLPTIDSAQAHADALAVVALGGSAPTPEGVAAASAVG